MAKLTKLSESAWRILEGLAPGNNHYVSASEMPYFGELTDASYVDAWMSQHGIPMWRITDLGRQALSEGNSK